MPEKTGFATKLAIFVSILAIFISSITLYRMYVSNQQDLLSQTTIDFGSNFGKYNPINVKTRDGATVTVKGVATYDVVIIQEHYVLKNIDRDFVYRQLKAICEAEVIKRYEADMKRSTESIDKIKYNMDRVGITVKDFELEVR
jgi:hypothetical protein